MYRSAIVKWKDQKAGILQESEDGYTFIYDEEYLKTAEPQAVSLTLPLQAKYFSSRVLFPFFDGLIPEGWLLDIIEQNWKFNERDRMGILLACCQNCIGAVSVEEIN